jgi:hypothetical protein
VVLTSGHRRSQLDPIFTIAASESVSLTTLDECPFPSVSSTSNTLPTAKRRDSPSLAMTCHSPLRTKNRLRADEACQSLDHPAGAFMKANAIAGVAGDKYSGGEGGA